MNILVTGATGFIGSVLTKELLKKGHRVRALVLPWEDASWLEDCGVEVHRGDMTKAETLMGLCSRISLVFHCAARVTDWGSRDQFYSSILYATENILAEAAGKSKRFIYISSVAALGAGRHLKGAVETDAPVKTGVPYNDAKADAEKLVREYHAAGKIACTIVRPANVIGPGSVWVRDIVERMLSVTGIPLIDGGRYSSSFVYIDSLTDGIIRAGYRELAEGQTYHFRDDWDVSWKQYITDLGSFIGKQPKGNIPFGLAWSAGWILENIVSPFHKRPPLTRLAVGVMGRDNDVDTSLAKSDLGWKTKIPYPEAMEKIGSWIKTHYK